MGGEISRFTLDADPQLPQATFQLDDGPTEAWDLVANTPVELRYRRLEIGGGNFLEETFVINKKSAEVRQIRKDLIRETNGDLTGICSFKSL